MSFRPLSDMQFPLGNLQDEINHLIERFWHKGLSAGPFDGQQWAPAVDLFEHSDHYTLFAEVPGVDPTAIEVTHVGAVLTIRGDKPRPEEIVEEDRALRSERRFGAFCRTIELPGDIDVDRFNAKCQGGVLRISIPKSEAAMAKSVKVEVQED